MADETKPPGGVPPANPNQINPISPEWIKSMEDATKRTKSLEDAYKESVKVGKEFTNQIIEQEKEINKLINSKDKLSTTYELNVKNLESEISALQTASSVMKSQLNASVGETIKTNKDLEAGLKTLNGVLKGLAQETDNVAVAQNNFNESLKEAEEGDPEKIQKYRDALELLNTELESGNELTEEKIKLHIKNAGLDEDETDNIKTVTELLAKQTALKVALNKQKLEESEQRRKDIIQELALNDVESKKLKSLTDVDKAMGSYIDKLTGASSQTNLLTSAVLGASKGIGSLAASIVSGFMSSLVDPEKALNRFFNFLQKNLIQSTFEFDKILSQVNKTTGGMGKEFEQIAMNKSGPFSASAVSGLALYGVGLQEVGNAYAALSSKVNGFNDLSAQQRKLLSVNAATMENLGVSAQSYAALTSNFMGAVGKTVEGTKNAINSLAKDAIAAGRSVGEYTKEFEQLMPKIIGYGREATTIFKELNSFAAMTKGVMSTGDLQNFASQFDNWDSAAESVSKLNAALGGTSLNIEDLMRADPGEKLMMLKRTFDESGQDFDKLNIGYKRLLAESFGGDVSKAAAFFKGNLADANRMMNEQAATEKELEERKKKSVAAQEKLNKALDGMKIAFVPIIDAFATVAGWFAKLNEMAGGFGSFLTVGIPLGIIAAKAAMKLFANTIESSISQIFKSIISELRNVTTAIKEAKREASEIPEASKGGGSSTADIAENLSKGGDKKGPFKEAFDTAGGAKGGGWKKQVGSAILAFATSAAVSAISNVGSSNGSANSTQPASAMVDASTTDYEDGTDIVGPGNQKVLYDGIKPIARFAAGDTTVIGGAKDPSKLSSPLGSSSTNNNSLQVIDRSVKEYGRRISDTVRETNNVKDIRIAEMFTESLTKTLPQSLGSVTVNAQVKGPLTAVVSEESRRIMKEDGAAYTSESQFSKLGTA